MLVQNRNTTFSSPDPMILLACGRNRELWEQPFQACAIDADYVRPDGQNSVISFVVSKWLLPELSIPAAGQKDRRLWGREWIWRENGSVLSMCTQVFLGCHFSRFNLVPGLSRSSSLRSLLRMLAAGQRERRRCVRGCSRLPVQQRRTPGDERDQGPD